MPATKKVKKSVTPDPSHFIAFAAVIAFLLIISGVLSWGLYKQTDVVSKYELLELIDNQACRYLDKQPAVNGSFNLTADTPTGSPKLIYTCLTGESVEGGDIQGKYIDGYELGASVTYFSTNQEAEKYAEEKINPLRYWGVDEVGQQNNIPQTSKFTFIVTDGKTPYFDAYTVKATAVLRISLPCSGSNPEEIGATCSAQAEAMLDRELKGINVL